MEKKLSTFKLVLGILINVAIFGGLLFLPAWTVHWWRAWVFLGMEGLMATAGTVRLNRTNPAVLQERFKPPIQQGQPLADKIIVLLLITTFCGLVAFIPLDVFRWHILPKPGTLASSLGLVLFLAGWWIMILALQENAFAALAVKHQEGQKVVASGVYGVVRHPMYAGSFLLFVGMPLWLESYAGALLWIVPIATLGMWRIRLEEAFLSRELPAYEAYTQKVRYRLIPFLW
jgi:protein-S-isoprenylcysteine O-methyltransferase Ste14